MSSHFHLLFFSKLALFGQKKIKARSQLFKYYLNTIFITVKNILSLGEWVITSLKYIFGKTFFFFNKKLLIILGQERGIWNYGTLISKVFFFKCTTKQLQKTCENEWHDPFCGSFSFPLLYFSEFHFFQAGTHQFYSEQNLVFGTWLVDKVSRLNYEILLKPMMYVPEENKVQLSSAHVTTQQSIITVILIICLPPCSTYGKGLDVTSTYDSAWRQVATQMIKYK